MLLHCAEGNAGVGSVGRITTLKIVMVMSNAVTVEGATWQGFGDALTEKGLS